MKLSRPCLAITAALIAALVALPEQGWAQASRLGASFNIPVIGSILKRYPDVAYDHTNRVYLAVHGNGNGGVGGAFVSQDGAPIGGPFQISQTAAFTQTPRAAFSPASNSFLVTWLDTRLNPNASSAWGAIVSFNGGAPTVGTNFLISGAPGGVHSEMGAALAYSTASQAFLVAWMQYGPASGRFDIRAQRIAAGGQFVGGEITVTADNAWQAQPSVAYNPATDEFFVAYGYSPDSGGDFVMGKRIQASTGSIVGSEVTVNGGVFLTVPEVQYNETTGQYLVAWYQGGPKGSVPTFYGRFINANGSAGSAVTPLVAGYGSYDGFDIDWNRVSNTYLAIFHDNFSSENIAVQVTATGTPQSPFVATGSGGTGNFNPRLAASRDRAEWLIVTARSFQQVIGQRIQSADRSSGAPGPSPAPTPTSETIDVSAASAPNGGWYFAEGATGGSLGFDTYYLIANENSVEVQVRAYFATETGFAKSTTFSVGPLSRKTIRLADHVTPGSYSALFQATTAGADIFVQRNVLWGPNFEGSAGSAGVKGTSQTWYFAEGSRRGEYFRNYFLIFNPTQTAGSVTLAFYGADGSGNRANVTQALAAQGRISFDAGTIAALANSDFSVVVTSTVPVVAERSMYWQADFRGGTNSFGTTAASGTWYFAEGAAAANFETYYTILNPNSTPVTVTPSYFLADGRHTPRNFSVPANSRETIWLTGEVGVVGGAGAQFTSIGGGIIVERSIYWGRNWVDGTSAMGVTAPALEWHLPDGAALNGLDTFVLVANPNPFDVAVFVTALRDDGLRLPQSHIVKANSRKTFFMNDFDTRLQGRAFSTIVQSVTTGGGVLAEIAVYLNRAGVDYWRAGSAAFGIPR